MRSNVSILTSSAEVDVLVAVTGQENAVAAHVAGDWGAHNQVLFYPALAYAEPITNHTIPARDSFGAAYLLRLQLSGIAADGTGDGVFTVPAIVTGVSGMVGGLPIFIRQPASIAGFVGQTVSFKVVAASALPMTYQWRKGGIDILGATVSLLVLPNIPATAQASYDVVATNAFGSTTSSAATLTIGTIEITDDGGFNFFRFLLPPPIQVALALND